MSFQTRLITGHVILLLLIAGIGLASIVGLQRVAADSQRIADEMSADLVAVEHLRLQAEQVVSKSRGYLLTGHPSYRLEFTEAHVELAEAFHQLRSRLDPYGQLLLIAAQRVAEEYAHAATEAARRRATHEDPSAVLPYFDAFVKPRRDVFESQVAALARLERDRFRALHERSHAEAHRAELLLVIASALAIAIGLSLASLTIRRLSSQYRRLQVAQAAARDEAGARAELLAVVSHDLRNPLNSIALASSLLDDSVTDAGKHHLRVVHNASERMLHMINRLLEVDSLERADRIALQLEPCRVKQVFADLGELFLARATERGVELAIEPNAETIVCDRERLIEILSNLVGNALAHTIRGGRITVGAEPHGDQIKFTVSDTGPGILPEQLPHLFERYWRGARQRASGFGLGLYICKRLVEAHGGMIDVKTRLGVGTTFWFTLPRESVGHP